uniref:KIAA1462 n=1 Tax=Nothobranchius pienaari TaxID=704102 RepID=A0A1A8MV37_9TELE
MYSVEDLLISHGYKLARHATSSTPTPVPPSSSHQPPSSHPSYRKHHEILENRTAPRTVNGYERGPVVAVANSSGARHPQVFGGGCHNNIEPRDGRQPQRDSEIRGQTDTHSLGESLTSDSGFCDGNRGPQIKDVSLWRRRGQDFSVLLDYTDLREAYGREQGGHDRPEGPQQARGQELSIEDRRRATQERQRWAAQTQAQTQAKALTQGGSREREAALHQWRMTAERKCQSLGTEDWHPAVSFGHQFSQNDSEHWAKEQKRLHARTPEGIVVHPGTKVKSQSLPRMLPPENLHYVDVASSGQELNRRVNGHPLSYQNLYRARCWPDNGRPASANQLSTKPKPRFTRPPRPPSYEMHQQLRGSCEVLSGRESVPPPARDRTPLPISRTTDPHLDYFAQDSGPPGYIPPPSYKRVPIMGAVRRGYGEVPVDYRYRGHVYQQIQVAPDGSHWLIKHPASSWPKPCRERSLSGQKLFYPVYSTHEHPGVQYISFDDPRIRHISPALGGNSLTDADKIRHIRNELPSVTVSEPAPDVSAFLPPPLGPFISAKLSEEDFQTSSNNFDYANNRWRNDLHKETIDNFPAPDQNCNNRHPLAQLPSSLPASAFQALFARTSSQQRSRSDQVLAETITQVKTIVPDSEAESNRNTKRRVSETIFCLVSVPVHTPVNFNKDSTSDQNNNKATPNLTITKVDTFAVGLRESPNIRSKSVNEMPIKSHHSHFHTSSTSSLKNSKRAPLRKEVLDAWVLQANEDKELCFAGSWPGNQYRNQETQTGSPVTGVKSPEHQESTRSASIVIMDNTGTDSTSSYGYPLAGQKNLHLSSNSAFSRLNLSLSPPQTPFLQFSQQDSSSPSKVENLGEHQSSFPSIRSPESTEPGVFGQFLLKPVNRRPCDAIGELETINKEMEDTISKIPNLGPDGADRKLAWLKLGAHFNAGPEPGRGAISLPSMHMEKTDHVKKRSTSVASSAGLESMQMISAFSRLQTSNITSELLPSPGDDCLHSSVTPHNDFNHFYRQDIPVPQESLLRDVGLTVYTETQGGPGKPMQRSLSVTSPLTYNDFSQFDKSSGSSVHHSHHELDSSEQNMKPERIVLCRGEGTICRTRSKSCILLQKDCSTHIINQEDDFENNYAAPQPLAYREDSTADKHLESLLIKEKTNTLLVEDHSNLYEVKCAKGLPENESIEERAARILGIAVPVEALCVTDPQHDVLTDLDEEPLYSREETQQMTGKYLEVSSESLIVQKGSTEEVKASGVEASGDHSDYQDTETQSVLGLPEFPPSKLLLSLPITPDQKLSLNMCSTEKRGRGGASKLIETLQGKLNCSALSRSTTDRMIRLKELDSVSRIRRLSLKSPESEECVWEEKDDVPQQAKKGSQQKPEKEEKEGNKGNKTRSKGEEKQDDCVNKSVEFVEAKEPKDKTEGMNTKKQTEETVEAVLEANIEEKKKVNAELNTEKEEMELKIMEDTGKTLKAECNPALMNRCELRGNVPIPKQRTRFKPPLLPKPRSVPKRQIPLPPNDNTKTGGPMGHDGEGTPSLSDSYDPSRVEKV